MADDELIYHYCSVEAFYNIIKSGELWLSSVNDTNDITEYKWLNDKYINAINDNLSCNQYKDFSACYKLSSYLINNFPFISCFSKHDDILSQWRCYAANGSGVSIGYVRSKLCTNNFPPLPSIDKNTCIGICDVNYDEMDHNNLVESFIQNVKTIYEKYNGQFEPSKLVQLAYDAANNANKWSIICKNPSFIEENEVRLIYTPFNFDKSPIRPNASMAKAMSPLSFDFRYCNNRILKHYIFPFEKNAITKITLGPNCKLNIETALEYIRHCGISNNLTIITKSKSTFRS